jgi:hypothetical protein
MSTDNPQPDAEVYAPEDRTPADRRAPATLPRPEALLPEDFPVTGFMQLLRLARATRLSNRYAAALAAMENVHRAAAGVEDGKLELDRAIQRLEDKDTILTTDKARRDAERLRAETEREEAKAALEQARVRAKAAEDHAEMALDEAHLLAQARKLQAQIEVYRMKRTLASYKNDTTPGASLADQMGVVIDRLVAEMSS